MVGCVIAYGIGDSTALDELTKPCASELRKVATLLVWPGRPSDGGEAPWPAW